MSELYSYHIFVFPFKWVGDVNNISLGDKWEGINFTINDKSDYNEFRYFYDFVNDIMYQKDDNKPFFKHFQYKDVTNLKYYIEIYDKGVTYKYELDIEFIILNLYQNGVGVLSFHLGNYVAEKATSDDILRINQYGRRLFPPSFSHINKDIGKKEWKDVITGDSTFNEMPKKISIIGIDCSDCPNCSEEDFSSYKEETNFDNVLKEKVNIPKFISCLFMDSFLKSTNIKPVLDDRMFVVSWYGNDSLVKQLKQIKHNTSSHKKRGDKPYYEYAKNAFWAKYVFIDYPNPTYQNKLNVADYMEKHTYSRWIEYGTLYGVTRYSFVSLTSSLHNLRQDYINAAFLVQHVKSMYYKMVELVLVQRAYIQYFSDQVTELSQNPDAKKIQTLYLHYIQFVNKIYFREITAYEQGIELYDMLHKEMRIEQHVKDLDNEIEELHTFASLLEDEKRNSALDNIAKLGVPIAALSLLVSIVSMWVSFIGVDYDAKFKGTYAYHPNIGYFIGLISFFVMIFVLFYITYIHPKIYAKK